MLKWSFLDSANPNGALFLSSCMYKVAGEYHAIVFQVHVGLDGEHCYLSCCRYDDSFLYVHHCNSFLLFDSHTS